MNHFIAKLDLPTTEDYEGVIEAIHRLEDTYLIDPQTISNGKMSEKFRLARPLTGNFFFQTKLNIFVKIQ